MWTQTWTTPLCSLFRCNSAQWVGGRPFWSQFHNALSAQEGQPDQHADPEGPLLHQKTLCFHPQPGVYVEAGLGWVVQSQPCHLIHVLMFVKLIAEWVMPLSWPFGITASFCSLRWFSLLFQNKLDICWRFTVSLFGMEKSTDIIIY